MIYTKIGTICMLMQLIFISYLVANPVKYEKNFLDVLNSDNNESKHPSQIECQLPVFLKSNSDFYDKSTGLVNMKEIKRLLRKLEFQMYARYGREEVKSGLANLSDAKFKFDEFDLIYLSIKAYMICLDN